jgi:hypothetical protein
VYADVFNRDASSSSSQEVDLRMHDSHMSRQRIVPRNVFLRAKVTPDLLLTGVVDRVLVPGEIVGPRKDGVAGLAGRRLMRSHLCGPA